MDAITKSFDDGKKFVLAELPTGIGKSMIAVGLSAVNNGDSFITTSQNLLIDQYEREFAGRKDFAVIKGKNNYPCTCFETCKEGDDNDCRDMRSSKEAVAKQEGSPTCKYVAAREKARHSKIAFTNSTYYALAMRGELWSRRDLATMDECHNIPSEVMNLTQFMISDKLLMRLRISSTIPQIDEICMNGLTVDDAKKSVIPVDDLKFMDYLYELKSDIENRVSLETGLYGSKDVAEKLEDLLGRINWYIDSKYNDIRWVIDYHRKTEKYEAKIIARPLDTGYFAKGLFFSQADRFLLQSATIIDRIQFAKECNIPMGTGQAMWVKRDSPFDLCRRPIAIDNYIGDINHKTMDAALPKISKRIAQILTDRKDQKGLIHTGSYKIQAYLENIYKHDERCVFLKPGERAEMIRQHVESDEPTVLFSPSLTEGFDGKGDIIRFQVMCKVPWPDLGDRRVKIKADEDFEWYRYQAAKTFIQAMGRGMRAESDWCCNYLLDASFGKFIRNYSSMPQDIVKTLIDINKMPIRIDD